MTRRPPSRSTGATSPSASRRTVRASGGPGHL